MNASRRLMLGLCLAAAAATNVSAQDTTRVRVQVRSVPRDLRVQQVGIAPTVTAVKPVGIRAAGGTTVTIDGTGFGAGVRVTVGGAAALGLDVVSPTQLRVTTPAGAAGASDVVVTTNGGSATCTGCVTYDPDLGPGAYIDEMWERGGEGPLGFWREERLQKGMATTVLMEAHCPSGWLPIGAGIENSAMTPFYMATSYPVDNKWRILMERRMVPPVGGQLLFPPAPYTFFMTVTCLNRDAFNRVMRPPSN
jgi:IPT/TIG domain